MPALQTHLPDKITRYGPPAAAVRISHPDRPRKKSLCAHFRQACLRTGAFVLFAVMLAGLAVPAQALEIVRPSGKAMSFDGPAPVPPDAVAADACLNFLNPARYAPAPAAAPVRDYAASGGAAALGLVFGLRFALAPKEVARRGGHRPVRFDVWEPGAAGMGPQALAVADYRRCKNEAALDALTDWRWRR